MNQIIGNQFSPRGRLRIDVLRIAVVGNHRNLSGLRHRHPGTHCFKITPTQDVGMILPIRNGSSFATVKFIAVGSYDEFVGGVGVKGEEDEAHGVGDR